jgi:hypothetical protein
MADVLLDESRRARPLEDRRKKIEKEKEKELKRNKRNL